MPALLHLPVSMEEYKGSLKGLTVKQDVAADEYDFLPEIVPLPTSAEAVTWREISAAIEGADGYGAYRHLHILQREAFVLNEWIGLNIVAPKTIFSGSHDRRVFVAYLVCSESQSSIAFHCLSVPFPAATFRLLKVWRRP